MDFPSEQSNKVNLRAREGTHRGKDLLKKKEMPDKRIGDPRLREDDEKGCGVLGAEPLGEGVADAARRSPPR